MGMNRLDAFNFNVAVFALRCISGVSCKCFLSISFVKVGMPSIEFDM